MIEAVILSGADADLDDIYAILDERNHGDAFVVALDRKLGLLRTFPRLHPPKLAGKVRRTRIGRTPYGLFYTIEGNRLLVIAIQDLRQEPAVLARVIRSRL